MAYKNSLSAHKKSDKIKWVIVFALVILLAIGFAGMAVVLNRQIKTVELTSLSYEIGVLDETGAEEENNAAIRTKDFVSVDGLTVKVCKEPTVTYQLFFYDTDKKFISSSDELSADYSSTIPENAEYVKVMITPIEDENGVTFTEMSGHANQFTVTGKR